MNNYPFERVVKDSTADFHKIKMEDYLPSGSYRIIDQGKSYIAGYTNNDKLVNIISSPIIIFGDHTKIFKFIDFPLALGADGAKALTIKDALADPKYLYYYFKSIKLTDAGYSRHFKFLKQVSIPLPDDFNDQIRIATVLTRAEKLIAKRKESIKALDELLKSTFLEMFGDPVRNEKGWEKKELKFFGQIITGNTPPRNNNDNYSSNFIEWIKTDNISADKTYLTQATEYLSETGIERARFVTSGALLVACIAGSIESIGRAALSDRKVSFNQQINAIQPNPDIAPLFLYWLFRISKLYIQSHATKGMKKILTKGDFEKILMIYPSTTPQKKFADIVEKVEVLKSNYRQSLTELENLYGSLSQRAFKGELDLSRVPTKDINVSSNLVSGNAHIKGLAAIVKRNSLLTEHARQIAESFATMAQKAAMTEYSKSIAESIQNSMAAFKATLAPLEALAKSMRPKYLEESFAVLNKIADSLKPLDIKFIVPQLNLRIPDQTLQITKQMRAYLDSVDKINQAMRFPLMQDAITKANKLLEPWSEEYISEKIKEEFRNKPFTIQDVLDLTNLLYEVPAHYDPYQVMLDKDRKPIGLKELFFNALAKNSTSALKLRQVYVDDPATNVKRVMLEVAS